MKTAAILEGQSTIDGSTANSYPVMYCGFPINDRGLQPLETILGGTDGMFDVPQAPGTFLDISDFASSRLGTANQIGVNANAPDRSSGARMRFFFDAPDMQQIVDGAGQTLKLSLRSGSPSATGPVATFTLPQDNAPVRQMMSACLAKSAKDAEALKAWTVAAVRLRKTGTFSIRLC